MDTNAEEKMINLRKKRELLLDKAKKYTQSICCFIGIGLFLFKEYPFA